MKKSVLTILAFLGVIAAFCQTPAGSFRCNLGSAHGMTTAQISDFITRGNYENYRLQNKRTALTFDNGFEIILLSANEAQAKGLISNASAYQEDFIAKFRMPVFHMTSDGNVSAAYPVINSKYSSKNR